MAVAILLMSILWVFLIISVLVVPFPRKWAFILLFLSDSSILLAFLILIYPA